MSTKYNIIITPERPLKEMWRELKESKELIYFLTWRDFKVRYRQTTIGVAWAVLRPLMMMVVFTMVFSKMARLPSEGDIPYPLLVMTGMLPWFLFAAGVQDGSYSLINNANIINKVYFPRIILPISTLLVNMVDFVVSVMLLFILFVCYGFSPDIKLLLLPLMLIPLLASAMGLGLLLSALNVLYRDFRYLIPFLLQLGLYTSPVGFSSNLMTTNWKLIYSLNPMVGVIDGFRWSLLGSEIFLYWPGFAVSWLASFAILIIGFWCFYKTDKNIVDLI